MGGQTNSIAKVVEGVGSGLSGSNGARQYHQLLRSLAPSTFFAGSKKYLSIQSISMQNCWNISNCMAKWPRAPLPCTRIHDRVPLASQSLPNELGTRALDVSLSLSDGNVSWDQSLDSLGQLWEVSLHPYCQNLSLCKGVDAKWHDVSWLCHKFVQGFWPNFAGLLIDQPISYVIGADLCVTPV